MTKQEAFKFLNDILANVSLSRAGHVKVTQALSTLLQPDTKSPAQQEDAKEKKQKN